MHKKFKFNRLLIIIFCIIFHFFLDMHYIENIPIHNLEENPLPTLYGTKQFINLELVEERIKQDQLSQMEIEEPIEETTTEIVETTTSAQEKETIKQIQKKKSNKNFGTFKSYTDYRCLSHSSPQWELQEQAYTDENGLRKIGDAYLVALGSYYGTKLGTEYEVTLSNGNSFTIILCDCKDDHHTDRENKYTIANGCVIEFYVETDKMPLSVRQRGSISAIEFFNGSVVSIEKTAE